MFLIFTHKSVTITSCMKTIIDATTDNKLSFSCSLIFNLCIVLHLVDDYCKWPTCSQLIHQPGWTRSLRLFKSKLFKCSSSSSSNSSSNTSSSSYRLSYPVVNKPWGTVSVLCCYFHFSSLSSVYISVSYNINRCVNSNNNIIDSDENNNTTTSSSSSSSTTTTMIIIIIIIMT